MTANLSLLFDETKFSDAKRFLVAVKPWWGRYLERFEVIPISVPMAGEDVRCTVRVVEHSLSMYADVEFVNRAGLPELAGAIEHELQRSRRRFDDRRLAMNDSVTDEYWQIATRMEVASALDSEYKNSRLSTERTYQEDNLVNMLLKSPVFDDRLLEKYEIDSLPVADLTWMPGLLDMPSQLSAEEYAEELVRRAAADDADDTDEDSEAADDGGSGQEGDSSDDAGDSESGDSPDNQEQTDAGGQTDENTASGESEQQSQTDSSSDSAERDSDSDDDHSDDDHRTDKHSGAPSDSDSHDERSSDDEDDSGSEGGEREPSGGEQSGSSSGAGENERNDPQRFDNPHDENDSSQSPEPGDGSSDTTDSVAAEEDDASGNDYQQLNTDNGQGQGRSGNWQSENEELHEREASDSALLEKENQETASSGVEESKQIASSDARTDRASSGTTGQISESDSEPTLASQLQSLRQEYPSLDFDASEFRPEIYDDEYSSEPDEVEQIERELERSEREVADEELIEDVKNASGANSADPLAPLPPSFDDVEIADYEQKRRHIHWTDMFAEIVSSRVQSIVVRGSDEFSYQRRSPNQSLLGPILMGGISYTPVVYVVFDTSPSMRSYVESQKATLADIFDNIQETMNARVRWFAADVDITRTGETDTLDRDVLATFQWASNGTNFCGNLNELVVGEFSLDDEDFDEPDVLILLSDMEFKWSGELADDEEPDVEFIPVIPKRNTTSRARRGLRERFRAPRWIFESENLVEMV